MTSEEILQALWKGKRMRTKLCPNTPFPMIPGYSATIDGQEIGWLQVLEMRDAKLIREGSMEWFLTDEGLKKIGKPTKAEFNRVVS